MLLRSSLELRDTSDDQSHVKALGQPKLGVAGRGLYMWLKCSQ
jgi:hypothetical protein